jgi:hypothetical protein
MLDRWVDRTTVEGLAGHAIERLGQVRFEVDDDRMYPAGRSGDEVRRLADAAIEELLRELGLRRVVEAWERARR